MGIKNELDIVIKGYEREFAVIIRKTTFELFARVVQRTPVDTGVTRNSWFCAVGQPMIGTRGANKTGVEALAQINSVLNSIRGMTNVKIFLTNNQPQIYKLEFGGYPNPPKRGTWVKGKGKYEVKTVNGFSVKAPQGMVGLSVAEWKGFFDRLAR